MKRLFISKKSEYMSQQTSLLANHSYQELYAQFYQSMQSFVDMWLAMSNTERYNYMMQIPKEERAYALDMTKSSIVDICFLAKEVETRSEAIAIMMPIINRLYYALEFYTDSNGNNPKIYFDSILPYLSSDVVDDCLCTDCCLAPIVVVKTNCEKFALYGISEIGGMGNAFWHNKITNENYDEILNYSSFGGVAHIAICKNNKWGLIEFFNNNEANFGFEWKLIAEIKHTKDEIEAIVASKK